VFAEAWVVVRVNDGEFALCQPYPAEGIAEAESPKGEHEPNGDSFEASWDFDSDDKNQDTPPAIGSWLLVIGDLLFRF